MFFKASLLSSDHLSCGKEWCPKDLWKAYKFWKLAKRHKVTTGGWDSVVATRLKDFDLHERCINAMIQLILIRKYRQNEQEEGRQSMLELLFLLPLDLVRHVIVEKLWSTRNENCWRAKE